ncbi:leucine-rich repeat flightless-interacting protein 2-like [Stegostoma tigrinum]|uniref:leucine-rich repeat flightless-interacting protein 2-like n=1 Tax=Stegostoma tigrinum TaxID=3053191 RepID=UPI00202AFE36|nr:leucine-rich repeat flightless-interacting protein 2-like [Stegostoma tigrinum]
MMGTPGNSRRRILSREMSDDGNMMLMIKEADAKFNARRASFAEAKEACAKKLVQQQQEIELLEKQAADQDIQEDLEAKYIDAVQSIDLLETEKTLLVYEVERLRDILESTEEELAELQRKHVQICTELETEKVAKHLLQQKISCMQEQLDERLESQGTEIVASENVDKNIQSNLQYHGYLEAKKMEFKSDKMRKHCVEKLQGSAVTPQDIEFKLSVDGAFETKSIRPQSMKIIEDLSNGNNQEGSMNIFAQQSEDDTHAEGSNDPLIEDSKKVMEGRRSEILERLELVSKEKDTEYHESNDGKEKEQNKLILEVNEVTSGETVQKREINEEQNEGNEDGTKEEISSAGFLSNGVEGGERKLFAYEAQSRRDEKELDNEHLVKNEEMDQGLQLSVSEVNEREDSRTREEESVNEEVHARESVTQKDNKEKSGTNANLDLRKQQTVSDGEETQHGDGPEQNTGGKEKGAFDMLEQLFKKIVTRQKSLLDSERQMSKEDYIDSHKDEINGARGEEIKEQDEEYVLAKEAQHRGKENKGMESISAEIEEETNELSWKGRVDGELELTFPERKETMTELIEEAAQLMTDLSNEEMQNSAESVTSEPEIDTYGQESKRKNEQNPENTTTNDDVELRGTLNTSESIKRHLKHSDTCQVS